MSGSAESVAWAMACAVEVMHDVAETAQLRPKFETFTS